MKRTLCLLSVFLCVTAGASADVLPESEAAVGALTLVRTVGSYTREHPEAAGAFPAWAPSGMPATAEPVLVHSYPGLEPAYYLIRIESTPPTFVTLDPRDGVWHAYGELPADDFPIVSRTDAAGLFSQELGRSCSETEIRAVAMRDRRLYWYVGPTAEGETAEFLVPLDGPGEVHRGTDDLPSGVPPRHSSLESEPEEQGTRETGIRGDPDRWGNTYPGGPYENIFADPLFCDPTFWELTLHDDSPCLPENNPWFEPIGALGSRGCGTSTGIHEGDEEVAARLRASPNPFRDNTTIEFSAPEGAGRAVVAVYNLKGQRVRTLLDGQPSSGQRILTWNGTDDAGRRVASGVYFCTAVLGNGTVSHRVVLLR